MNSLAFVTHPSVRIKGTENAYTPSQCLEERCPVKAPHMHCPFCVKTDAYQDPVILKAHYRVKHVDKGIEFAGLKILRCCDHCDIVGIIKGEKRFKGAHWHCYRCRNGFNRRDEAIKHYKTHFRNPQTTFQIQITQDLNSPPGVKPHDDANNLRQEAFSAIENPVQEIIHPALTQAALSMSEHNVITSDVGKMSKVQVKEEQLVKELGAITCEDEQTIMIIQGDSLSSPFTSHVINATGDVSVLNKSDIDSNLSWDLRFQLEEEAKKFKSQAEEYKNQVELLQQRVTELESQLSQSSELKVQDLLTSLNVGDPDKQLLAQQISKYLEELKASEDDTSSADICPSSHHLVTAEDIVHSFKLQPTTSLAQELEAATNGDGDMNSVSDSYQVLTSVVDSHRVLMNHNPEHSIPVSEVSASGLHSTLNGNSVDTAIVEPQAEAQQDMFPHVTETHNSEEMMVLSSAVDHVSAAPGLIETTGNLQRDEHTVMNIGTGREEGLLQVVAAADGLASLGTDVTVVASTESHESAGTFIMEVEGGQQLLVQRGEDDPLHPLTEETSLPESKRPRLS